MNHINLCSIENRTDHNNIPTGGYVHGVGVHIEWQDGPLGRGADRTEPNGAFVETVISAAKQRLEFYQTANGGKFACAENAAAIMDLDDALATLELRTARREAAQIEGTHTPDHGAPPAQETT